MMKKANFTHSTDFLAKFGRNVAMLFMVMFLFTNAALAQVSNPTITCTPNTFIPGQPKSVAITVSWTQANFEWADNVTLNIAGGATITLGAAPAPSGAAPSTIMSGNGTASVTFGHASTCATSQFGAFNATVAVNATVLVPAGNTAVQSITASVAGDGFSGAATACSSATTAVPATMTLQACIITVPASVTVNTAPVGATSAAVTLPLATGSMGCTGQIVHSNETFTGATQASLITAGWIFSGVPVMTAVQQTNYFRILAAAGVGGGAANPGIVGNRLVLDDDFVGAGFVGTGSAVSPSYAVPAGAISPKLVFDYRNGNATGDLFVDYSTDGGTTWTTIVSQLAAGFGCAEQALVAGVPIRVRVRYFDAGAWAWSGEVDNIRVVSSDPAPAAITNSFNAGLANASGLYPLGVTTVTYSVIAPGCASSAVTQAMTVTVNDMEAPGLNIPGNAGLTVTGPSGTVTSTGGTGTTADPFIFPVALGAGGCSANITYSTPTYTDNVPNPPAGATFASVVPAQTAANLALLTPTFGNLNTAIFPAVAPNAPTPLGIIGGGPGTAAGFPHIFFGFTSAVAQPLGVKSLTNFAFADANFAPVIPPATLQVWSRTDTNNPGLFAGSSAGWAGPVTAALTSGGITLQAIAVANAGGGYSTAPTVTITGGTPTVPATAIATINPATGAVTGFIILNPGAGYVTAPTITLSAPASAGSCAGNGALIQATATATLSPVRTASYTLPSPQFVTSLGNISFLVSTDPTNAAVAPFTRIMYDTGTLNSTNAAGTLLNGGAEAAIFGTPLTPRLMRCGLVFAQGSLQNQTPQFQQTGFTAAQGTSNISWKSTDIAGNMTTKAFRVVVAPSAATATTLACNDQINISTDLNCNAIVNAEKILKGGPYGCFGAYKTEVYNGTNLIGTTTYDAIQNCYGFNGTPLSAFAGQTLTAKVYDIINPNNSCWGLVTIEDKLAPVITCPGNLTLDDCSVDLAVATSVQANLPFTSANAVTAFTTTPLNVVLPVTGLPATSLVQGIKVRARFTTADWISNIIVELVSPTGTVFILKNGAGTGACNSAAQSPYDYTFTPSAAPGFGPLDAATSCANVAAWNNGSVLPVASLASLTGLPLNGDWTVRFRDTDTFGPNTVLANGVTIEFATTIPLVGATALDGCAGAVTPVLTTQVIDLPCGNPLAKTLRRTFKATDAFGNFSTCVQNVSFRRPTLATIVIPADVNLDCTYDNFKTNPSDAKALALVPISLGVIGTNTTWFDAAGNPAPSVTGRPRPSGGSCAGIVVDYQDMRLNDICGVGQGYTVMRTWKVYDACANALTTKAQQITVRDITAPVITPNVGVILASTGQASCLATVKIANPVISDNCATASQIKVVTELFTNTGTIATPAIGVPVGIPTANPNEYSDLPVSPTVFVSGLPRPLPYIVRYTAIDACGNATTGTGLIAIMDITAPVAVCPPTMKVSLTEDGSAIITAKEIDRGSYDNCTGIAKMEVRRMSPINNCTGKDVNNDGDYDDYLLQANSNVSFELPSIFFNTEEAAPFTGAYPKVESPYVALARSGTLSVVDNFNNGILERKIFKNLANWNNGRPDPITFPTLYITSATTVIFNSFGFTLTFDPGTNELLNVVPTTVYLPQYAPPAPFTTRALNNKGSVSVDPDLSDIYGDYNINGDPNDEDYNEYNYYNYYHPEVKLCCEDAGDTIMVAMRIWDASIYKHPTNNVNVNHTYYRVGYPRSALVRGNVNICMVRVIVEDKLAPKIAVQDTTVICGTTPQATAWLDTHSPVQGSYNATMSDQNLFSNNNAIALDAGGNTSIPINVAGLKSVKDLNIALKFFHTDLGNLTATITSPSGKIATLFATPVDANTSNPYNTAAINSANTLFRFSFDDEPTLSASTAIQLQAIPGVPNVITSANLNLINGNYLAIDELAIFDKEDPNGTWTIDIVSSDPASAGAGSIIAGGAQLWIRADRAVMPQGFFYDNCPGFCVTYTDAGTIDNCGKGTVTRTYTIKDISGRTATDVAEYTSINRSAYKVEFPADVTITCNNNKVYGTSATAAGAGIPTITPYAKTCPLVGVEFTDDTLVVNGLDNSCFKIVRKWKILNWCQPLNLNANKVQQVNPTGCASLVPRTFINIDYSAWAGLSVAAVNTSLGECTGVTYDADGYMEYVQVIKVIDNTAPTWKTVGTPTTSAVGKECKSLLTIPTSEAEDCTGKITYTYDIVRVSDNVVVGTGGVSGSQEFTATQFGAYIVRYRASDNCGNVVTSDKAININDAKKPTPVCFQGLSVDLMPTTGNVMIAASLLNAGSYDNCILEGVWIQTPAPGPGHSITEYTVLTGADPNVNMTTAATPNTVAKNVQFACVGFQTVALWAKDAAGNWDYCETYVDVQNNMGAPNVPNCNVAPPTGGKIASTIMTENAKEVENVMVKLTGGATKQNYTNLAGKLEFLGLSKTENYTVKPELDTNPLNGVSTLDLVLMSKHILGTQPLNSAYQLIAADVNHNGTVTTADIVELRKMILAVQTGFTKNTSWRFVDKAYQFPATNPLAAAFPESKQYNGINDTENAEFVAVKIGDVNGNAKTTKQAVGRGAVGTFFFNADEQSFNAGDEVRATLKADEIATVLGYQFTLGYNKSALDLLNIEGQTENFAVIEAGTITTSWNGNGEGLFTVVFKAKKSGTLSEMLNINSRYTMAEAYTKGAELLNVAIKYNNSTSKMELYQNQPNPFIGRTVIGFNLTKAENAKLSIHDATGRLLKVVEKDFAKGYNEVTIDDVQAVGVLKYTLSTASETATKSMIILE